LVRAATAAILCWPVVYPAEPAIVFRALVHPPGPVLRETVVYPPVRVHRASRCARG
jgi:hypothetical protein